ncbi:zinc finger and BTB domain-containing protein 40-like [Sinocyclocheilus grahami]|uniref:zinc finger and BTB domain-containing protein 40-like n=1 Tax=Sinocyclocheilus grahami TaxID=75366 RepID=UPI0007ACFA41|nr:PREDICTED: zinc finger and BTB domain-containing protein 40-like [Sinocyclocheilus grahami]
MRHNNFALRLCCLYKMELPNYSRQLMQQLHALRKEKQFCDCSILVGETPHPAHKLVLAASSMLFKSVLEGSDSISIDTDLLSSQEFSSLLDMVYTGKLPPGKHNFTRLIAAADSLQMFDVAVGCKNILNDLMKQTSVETELMDPQVVKRDCVKESSESEQVNRDKSSFEEDSAVELIAQNQAGITKLLQNGRSYVKVLEIWDTVSTEERQVILESFRGDPSADEVYQRLLNFVKVEKVLSAQTVLTLLEQLKCLNPDPGSLLEEQGNESCPEPKDSAAGVRWSGGLLDHLSELSHHLSSVNNLSGLLTNAVNRCINEVEKEVVLQCCSAPSSVEVVERLLCKLREMTISEETFLMLLHEVKESSSDLLQLLEALKGTRDKTTEDSSGMDLLRMYQNRLIELNLDVQLIKQSLKMGPDMNANEKECIEALLAETGDAEVVGRLISAALDGSLQAVTVWRLLLWTETHSPELRLLMQKVKEKPNAQKLLQTSKYIDVLFKHKSLILETISDITLLEQGLDAMAHGTEQVSEFLQSCRRADGELESVQQTVERVLSRDSEFASSLCQLLSANQQNFPQLIDLKHTGGPLSDSDCPAKSEVEQDGSTGADSEDDDGEDSKTKGRRKAVPVFYSCEWCNKTFDFKCCLIKHKKGCALAPGKEQRCSECSKAFPTLKSLHQHCMEVHGGPPAKKKKTELVPCDMCDKTFKHSSGLLYHKRTEHFEERPYACEECGAKFAASSSLKNHMRLHTGEKPFHCKHCDMSFSVAAALSYHTKKKHAEGKMYCCQYCSATFAQSIELTRHVRTHTGDKPYVCRECGKGFKQANGLSVHLQNFHNITEPLDCQKCRVSFSSLDELRQHIQEVHPKELHQCPECSKIFNSEANLEKHMNIHNGNKPYSCKTCKKSYQTLSGLWYHNRTSHLESASAQGNKAIKSLFQCDKCDKTFSNRNSQLKHQITNHTEVHLWKCVNCDRTLTSEQELQQHVCSGQSGSVFSCMVCSLHFPSEPYTYSRIYTILTENGFPVDGFCGSFQVIRCEDAAGQEMEQVISLDQSRIEGSPQVFVALGDQQETASGSGIVTVSMEDLLNGTVTLICEEGQ